MLNRREHIYLYSKYHYPKSDDPIKDLQTLIYKCEGLQFSRNDIGKIMLNLAMEHLDDKNKLFSFITGMSPDKWNISSEKEYDFNNALIRSCLHVLTWTEVKELKEKGIVLGEANPEIEEILKVKK